VVRDAGPGAGHIHSDLGSFHLLLRNLLQGSYTAGGKEVMSIDLLTCGIFVFVMLLIGLGLTVMEFRNMK
jgi:hypothetical protein